MPEMSASDHGEGTAGGHVPELRPVDPVDDTLYAILAVESARVAGAEIRAWWQAATGGQELPISVALQALMQWIAAEDDEDEFEDTTE